MPEVEIKMDSREAIRLLMRLQDHIKAQKLDRFGEWKLVTACQKGIDALRETYP